MKVKAKTYIYLIKVFIYHQVGTVGKTVGELLRGSLVGDEFPEGTKTKI